MTHEQAMDEFYRETFGNGQPMSEEAESVLGTPPAWEIAE